VRRETTTSKLLTYLLCLQMACQDEDEVDETGGDDEQAEHDCALVESAGELMPMLVKLISAESFAPYFTDLLPELLQRLVRGVTTDLHIYI